MLLQSYRPPECRTSQASRAATWRRPRNPCNCVTCTTSRKPLLGLDEVSPGTFIAAVGADNPEKQELHPALMAKSKIVADILEQCVAMGDLHHAIAAGVVTRANVHAELGEIVAGKKPGRESNEEITIFESTGMAYRTWQRRPFCTRKLNVRGPVFD